MRTTVTIDDELLAKAKRYADIQETSALVNRALKTLVEIEAARRLARLGGSEPDLVVPSRHRPDKDE